MGLSARVRLTAAGDRTMRELTRPHLERLRELAEVLDDLVEHQDGSARPARA